MKRKTFIYLTVAGAATLAGCRYTDEPLPHVLAQPDFLGHICDAKTIADIGTAYRKTVPGESQKTDLIRLLLNGTPGTQNDPRLPQLLNDQIQNDFATDNTVTIKGWVLSRTEARQCALYSFSQQ